MYYAILLLTSVLGGMYMIDYVLLKTKNIFFGLFAGLLTATTLYYSITNGYDLYGALQ